MLKHRPIHLILLLLIHAPLLAGTPWPDDTGTPPMVVATDLRADGELARHGRKAILLLISQQWCTFCIRIKQEVIAPMIRSGSYDKRLIIRELRLDNGAKVIDFNGIRRENPDFASDYKVSMTPTLLFLDSDGEELTAKMVGFQTPDMFYYYVDQSIQTAIATLDRKNKQ